MFRDMRRKNQQLSKAETVEMLQTCTAGVLAVSGDNDYPYTVPLSYAYRDGKLYFHFATEGHKVDSIARSSKASFCVIQADEVIPQQLTTYYRSAVVFGKIRILTDPAEKRHAMVCLAEKYSPDLLAEGKAEIERSWERYHAAELEIEHLTGKAAIELIKRKA